MQALIAGSSPLCPWTSHGVGVLDIQMDGAHLMRLKVATRAANAALTVSHSSVS